MLEPDRTAKAATAIFRRNRLTRSSAPSNAPSARRVPMRVSSAMSDLRRKSRTPAGAASGIVRPGSGRGKRKPIVKPCA